MDSSEPQEDPPKKRFKIFQKRFTLAPSSGDYEGPKDLMILPIGGSSDKTVAKPRYLVECQHVLKSITH